MKIQALIALITYFCILVSIGWHFHRQIKSDKDFVLGGRSLNFWVTAISAHASDMSGWLFMGLPMTIYLTGFRKVWLAPSLVLGMFLSWQFVAPKLRVQTEKLGCYTLSAFFEKRFKDSSGAINLITAIATILFLSYYLAVGMMSLGFLMESLFDIPYTQGILFASIVIILYTYTGGFIGIAWTDFFQGIFLLGVVALVPSLAYTKLVNTSFSMDDLFYGITPKDESGGFIWDLLYSLSWAPGYFGMPHILTKFMGLKDPSEMYKSKYVGLTWQILALSAAVCIGVVGTLIFPEGLSNPQLVFVEMTKLLFSPLVTSFILCAVLAAIVSTMDAQILVSASVISEDLYKRFLAPKASNRQVLIVSRLSVVAVCVIAVLIAWKRETTIMDATFYAWCGLGSSFGPLIIASLYFRNANRYGAIAGAFTGGFLSAVWPKLNSALFPSAPIPQMIPGFLGGLFTIYLVSQTTRKKSAR